MCRNLIKKPWAFTRVPYMNPTILGVIEPGFLNQVPTLIFMMEIALYFQTLGLRVSVRRSR